MPPLDRVATCENSSKNCSSSIQVDAVDLGAQGRVLLIENERGYHHGLLIDDVHQRILAQLEWGRLKVGKATPGLQVIGGVSIRSR